MGGREAGERGGGGKWVEGKVSVGGIFGNRKRKGGNRFVFKGVAEQGHGV